MIKSLKRKINRNSLYINASFAVQRAKKKLNPERGFHIDKIDKIMAAKGLFGISTFIETGTYLGVTTNYVQSFFKKVFTIELSKLLADEATEYFASKNHVKVLQGDSGLMLEDIVKNNPEKKLFWLDAHYSAGITASSAKFGDTPISREIEVILDNWTKESVILVDDAGLFVGKDNYPTLEELTQFVTGKNLGLKVFVDKGIIHIL